MAHLPHCPPRPHWSRHRHRSSHLSLTLLLTLSAYLLGVGAGVAADRGGPRLHRDWPIYLRVQLLATASLLGLFSAWQLTAPRQVVGPLLVTAVGVVILVVAFATRGSTSTGQAALEGWAAYPNGTFWVLPMAAAQAGPAAAVVTALSKSAYAGPAAVCIHLLRRDAPVPQRRSTSWIDQSALLAVAVGLLLHLAGPATAATHWVLRISGPLMAFVGAALFTGSVLHPQNVTTARTRADRWRWLSLTAVRVAYLLPLAVLTSSHAVAVVAVLSALGAPAFNPPQLAVLYGYRSGVVTTAVRWGWVFLPVGLLVAVLV